MSPGLHSAPNRRVHVKFSQLEDNLVCSLISVSVVLAVFSRLFVAAGAPSAIVFLHGPITILAAIVSATRPTVRHRSALFVTMAAFTSAWAISSVINGVTLFEALAFWLLFVEPFLLAYAVRFGSAPNHRLLLSAVCAACCLAQLPFCLVQHHVLGVASHDFVTGTFVGQRSGSHVAGALCGVGLIGVAASLMFARRPYPYQLGLVILAALLFHVLAITDSNLAAAVLVAPLIYLTSRAVPRTKVSAVFLATLVIVAVSASISAIDRKNLPEKLIFRSIEAKISGPAAVWKRLEYRRSAILFGAGPGKSISRLALLGSSEYRKESSPVAKLGLEAQEITEWVLRTMPETRSSVLSPFSSWGSLAGDLGLIGAALYLMAIASLWSRRALDWRSTLSNALLVYIAFLSIFQLWFEEPGLTLPLITLAAALSRPSTTSPSRQE